MKTTPKLVTFEQWRSNNTNPVVLVTVNPAEISSIEDCCGSITPGSQIIMRNNKSYLVAGFHEQIVAKLRVEEIMNNAEYITATIGHGLKSGTIEPKDAADILLRLATLGSDFGRDDFFPEMNALQSEVMRRYGDHTPFFVVCLEENEAREGSELEYVLATHLQFATEESARDYSRGIAKNREPLVLRVVPDTNP